MKIVVSCGGTGGHLIPGVVTGEALRERGHEVVFWVAGRDVEKLSLGGRPAGCVTISAEGFGGFSLRSLRAAFTLLRARRQCRRQIQAGRPEALLAMGSYASVGPVLAARAEGVPIVLHESNVIPGKAVQFLARYAAAVGVAFPETKLHLRHSNVVVTGFPVRKRLGSRFPAGSLDARAFTLLVIGGSQGAHALNEVVSEAIIRLHRKGLPVQVIHLAGVKDKAAVENRYREAGVRHLVFDFLQDMEQAYAAAHLAVCRAGAGTCAELAEFEVPALLIPLPSAARHHQEANARAMEAAGAADVMLQADLSTARLAEYIEQARLRPEVLQARKPALRSRATPDAARKLAELVEHAGRDDWRKEMAELNSGR